MTELPGPVSGYLDAHREHDIDTAIATFAPDAVVVDDGKTYRGKDEIRVWLARSSTEFEYSTSVTGTRRIDDSHLVVSHHLAGNFPGGEVDLDYAFELRDGLISRLSIAPPDAD